MDDERGAAARFADHGDVPTALLDDAVDDGQPEPGALALLFGGEERLEQLRARLRVDTRAGVADAQPGVPSGVSFNQRHRLVLVDLDVLDLDREAAASGHRVP